MYLKSLNSEMKKRMDGDSLLCFLSVFQADMNRVRIEEANQRANKLIK